MEKLDHHVLTAIWNRAAMDRHDDKMARGDRALAALLVAHGHVMNGGVLHAVELLRDEELHDAVAGYQFFGICDVGDLFAHAKADLQRAEDLDSKERLFDAEYARYVPDDSFLFSAFERHFDAQPADFAPT